MSLERCGPLFVANRFPPLGRELIQLLLGLPVEAWSAPTVARAWTVKDIAAHLLDTALRRVSVERDGWRPPPPSTPIGGYDDLVDFLNRLNRDWVLAMRRVGPRSLIELLTIAEASLAANLAEQDPFAPATFPVAWAGEEHSRRWFDVARELTERWLHQQQIRLAVGAPPLVDRFYAAPVFETFLLALPARYSLDRPPGTTLEIAIGDPAGQPAALRFALRREEPGWALWRGTPSAAAARALIPEPTAWLLFTKGLGGEQARQQSRLDGDRELLAPVFSTLAVMA